MNNLKEHLGGILIGIGSGIVAILGGLTPTLSFLMSAMAVDYITGLFVGLLKKSTKSETGGLSSNIGFKGLVKKVGVLVMVWIGYQMDLTFNLEICKNMIVVGYLANEVISIVENLTLLGVIRVKAIDQVLEMLKNKTENEEKD